MKLLKLFLAEVQYLWSNDIPGCSYFPPIYIYPKSIHDLNIEERALCAWYCGRNPHEGFHHSISTPTYQDCNDQHVKVDCNFFCHPENESKIVEDHDVVWRRPRIRAHTRMFICSSSPVKICQNHYLLVLLTPESQYQVIIKAESSKQQGWHTQHRASGHPIRKE